MNTKEFLCKEIVEAFGTSIDEETVLKKVDHFFRHRNVFLLFEIFTLRKEIEKLKEDLRNQGKKDKRRRVSLYQ
jgi:hypothetical protein